MIQILKKINMKLRIERKYFKEHYTIGNLYIDDKFFSNTLEDKNRDINHNGKFDNGEFKVYGETCIPFGTYEIIVSRSSKFKRDLPLLLNVPNFEGIRIHSGNTPEHTLGCILVGENRVKGKVVNSRLYEGTLVKKMKEAILKGEKIEIEIV